MIDQGVNAALAARDANRTGDDSHTSGTGVRRTERVTRECTYQDFMKIVSSDAAYVMTWIELKKKMADKYCPRNEMKKIETELWNLEKATCYECEVQGHFKRNCPKLKNNNNNNRGNQVGTGNAQARV
nr:hypothetical protein [Tanacetum cinerariifolium]